MKKIILALMVVILCGISGCKNSEEAAVERGFRWYHRGDYNRAIDTFTTVLAANPTNKYALAGRGDAFAEKKEYEKALEDYDKGLEADPSWAALYYHRGVCWQEYAQLRGWYDENKLVKALTDYTKAIELDPVSKDAYINRAFINKMMGKYDLAIVDYDKILNLEPENKRAKLERDKTVKAKLDGAKPEVREDPPSE
jgi:tetratricopeptide (TPR) repeat protein